MQTTVPPRFWEIGVGDIQVSLKKWWFPGRGHSLIGKEVVTEFRAVPELNLVCG
jgi:hypothetical protein